MYITLKFAAAKVWVQVPLNWPKVCLRIEVNISETLHDTELMSTDDL